MVIMIMNDVDTIASDDDDTQRQLSSRRAVSIVARTAGQCIMVSSM